MENNTSEEPNNAQEDLNHFDGICMIPTVCDEFKPTVGLQFGSLDLVYVFYNRYAFKGGFGIKQSTSKKIKGSDFVTRKEFRCYKSGCHENFEGKHNIRQRSSKRICCPAKIAVLFDFASSMYRITVFKEEHNHLLTSLDTVQFLTSHRNLTDAQKVLLQQLESVNMPVHQQASLLAVQSGGLGNIGCTIKDLYNNKNAMRGKVSEHDARLLREHFKAEKKKDITFDWFMEVDEYKKMKHVFWADGRSRRAYSYFGDVLVFDTTFNTNRYGLSFAPIIGVNNHRQTQLVACAFLRNESFESFCWLFKQLKKAMPGGPPKMIITDQDPAIAKAIKECLPTTFHRLCIWHIINKFGEKGLGDAISELINCIWEVDNKEEYDTKWSQLISSKHLEGNEWLSGMHGIRHFWVPAYVKHVFSAGMSSSQRSESCHAFFKKSISSRNTLMEFIVRFDRAVAKQRHKELFADHLDNELEPPWEMRTASPMAAQMAKVYTRSIFDLFFIEQKYSNHCFLSLQVEDSTRVVYKVEERVTSGVSIVKEIVYDKSIDQCFCSCKGMEFRGIPCRHILSWLRLNQVIELPEKYILKRWTQSAKIGVVYDNDGNEIKDLSLRDIVVKRASLAKDALDLIDEGLLTDEGSELAHIALREWRAKMVDLRVSRRDSNHAAPGIGDSTILNPPKSSTKGRKKRKVGKKDRAGLKRKQYKCSGCKQIGHDIRKCTKEKRSSDTDEVCQDLETSDGSDSSATATDSDNDGFGGHTHSAQETQPSQHDSLMEEFDQLNHRVAK